MPPVLPITLVTLAITALWLINGWAMRRGSRSEAVGVCLCGVALLVAGVLGLAHRQVLYQPTTSTLGAITGLAHAVGFCIIIFHCLKIGPTGPTALLNNLGLIGPVVVGLIWFRDGARVTPVVWTGLGLTLATLVVLGLPGGQDRVSRRWFLLALTGWALASVANTGQLLAGRWSPGHHAAFVVAMYAVAFAVMLAWVLLHRTGWPRCAEWWAGTASGALFGGVVIPQMVSLSARVPAAVLFPVVQAGSIVLVLLVSAVTLRERLPVRSWIACGLGVAAIVLLSR